MVCEAKEGTTLKVWTWEQEMLSGSYVLIRAPSHHYACCYDDKKPPCAPEDCLGECCSYCTVEQWEKRPVGPDPGGESWISTAFEWFESVTQNMTDEDKIAVVVVFLVIGLIIFLYLDNKD